MVSHKVVLSRKVVSSWQALFRVPQVVSLRTSGGCGHRRNLGTVRFQNLEIAQKVESVTLGITGKTVTSFGRKLVQSIGFRNDTLNDIYYEKNMRKRRSR